MNAAALRPSLASLRCMIALVAIAVGFSVWEASQRQARVDDALAGASSSPWPDMRVDLNTATAAELAVLPGISAGLAERIVRDREANGAFATIQGLQRVPGLGETTINRLAPHAVAIPMK